MVIVAVNKVYNKCSERDQNGCEYLRKHIPKNGVHERIANLETQLSLDTAVPKNIYKRLKLLEDRLLHLESISPEYIQFWVLFLFIYYVYKCVSLFFMLQDKTTLVTNGQKRKKIYTIEEIDNLLVAVERRRKTSQ